MVQVLGHSTESIKCKLHTVDPIHRKNKPNPQTMPAEHVQGKIPQYMPTRLLNVSTQMDDQTAGLR
jgi:hypothetical protein